MSSVPTRSTDSFAPASMKLEPLRVSDLNAVISIEYAVYPFPWTRGNFTDSIESGYEAWVVHDVSGAVVGYFLMMLAIDEAHLLNITVRSDLQGRGIGRFLLEKAMDIARQNEMQSLLLEVRPSNQRALSVYQKAGFAIIGSRKNYYPAPDNKREDALVMKLEL
ncbi:ribosomal protein S18-alanine N-acetyltransferase [Oxalobacteraceae bacterium R-40]|uniref:[Ribosomal protein bS18]-alanine N-acetyltransferase n=1 Tax=Keguizhuia sedimenti TaxID=3064264 RepID=A0ABU1BRG5_9BURK|nr:ribosomal protein S18-alanine N-acetyltransferase [Oxalobacteraceae bacterium R-40]